MCQRHSWVCGLLTFVLILLPLAGCEARQPTTAAAPDTRPSETQIVSTLPVAAWAPALPTGTFIDRENVGDLRLVSYNILWNSIFPEVSAIGAAKFARLVRALNPDVLALLAVGLHPEDRGKPNARRWTDRDVVALMNSLLPPPAGSTWHACQGGDNVIVSKYPLRMVATNTDPPGERSQAIALVDLPDEQFAFDLYVLNNHYKCCGNEANDPQRQQQSDAIISWIRDARTPGGHIDLPPGTAIVIVGDLNIVGTFKPVETLLTGDISDESRYGPDFPPDWDDTGLVDARPRHNIDGADEWTWRNDNDRWPPGRLDFIIYADSVLSSVKQFVLNTTIMSPEDLAAAGLERFDVTVDDVGREYDHLPLVIDFRPAVRADEQRE